MTPTQEVYEGRRAPAPIMLYHADLTDRWTLWKAIPEASRRRYLREAPVTRVRAGQVLDSGDNTLVSP